MHLRLSAIASTGVAQEAEPYAAPRTAHGHADLQGVWVTEFLTMLERPPGVDALVLSPEQARGLAVALQGWQPEVIDPQVEFDGVSQLATVRGEYRSSVIVEPENGQLPYTQAGLNLAAWSLARDVQMFDGPEQRPLVERCLESFGYPPMMTTASAG